VPKHTWRAPGSLALGAALLLLAACGAGETETGACVADGRELNVGFYAHFAPISYSADPDPGAPGFHAHRGYEADLLTALEAMGDVGLAFSRRAIAQWDGIWLQSASPAYDIVGGGITILDSRTRNTEGERLVAFTAGHVTFRQSLLVRAGDAARLSSYDRLTADVRVGVLAGTTGEARLLQVTGLADADGKLAAGARVDTPRGTVVADGSAAYRITAAGTSDSLAGRMRLHPPSGDQPQVIYLGDVEGEDALLQALRDGAIDAVARGEIGNRDASHASSGSLVVDVVDEAFELGGFTVAVDDAELLACLNERLDYLTESRRIGYAEWFLDRDVFLQRARQWGQ